MVQKVEPNKDALTLRVTNGGLVVCRLHYAADAKKNPANRVGKEWLKTAIKVYDGGLRNADWRKEMEIVYLAGSGERILPYWHEWLQKSNIFTDGDIDIEGAKLYASYDHGYRNPACYLVHAIYPDNHRIVLWEFYAKEVPVSMTAKIIKGESVQLADGRVFAGNPYAGKEVQKICDPEIMRENQAMNDGPNKSVAELFRRGGVHFIRGSSGDDMTVVNWLTGNLWLNPLEPGLQIHRANCPNLIWELGRLQRKSVGGSRAYTSNQPEGLLDKDNHAWDALKYFLKRFPVGTKSAQQQQKEANFEFWRDLPRRKSRFKASYVRNFSRDRQPVATFARE